MPTRAVPPQVSIWTRQPSHGLLLHPRTLIIRLGLVMLPYAAIRHPNEACQDART